MAIIKENNSLPIQLKLQAALEIMKRTYGQLPRFIKVSIEDYREYLGSNYEAYRPNGPYTHICAIEYESYTVEVRVDCAENLQKDSRELKSLKDSLSTIRETLKCEY